MRLSDLDARFIRYVSDGRVLTHAIAFADADGVMFLCPKCRADIGSEVGVHSVLCWFAGRVPDMVTPGPGRWTQQGTGIDDLTLEPSINLSAAPCGWHGFIRNGDAT